MFISRQSYIYHINIECMYLSGEWHLLKMNLGQGNRLRVLVFHPLDALVGTLPAALRLYEVLSVYGNSVTLLMT